MKQLSFLVCACLITALSTAQDFSGYRSGNQTGVNGVFINPANIADSRFRWDVNLVSISTLAGNNQASFHLKNLGNSFNSDSLRSQLFGKNAGTSNGYFSMDVHGPSAMFNAGKKWAFAVTTRARAMGNAREIDGKLINKITEDFSNDPQLPYSISSTRNMRLAVNGWSEFGLTAARVLVAQQEHFLKAGITVKYLAGAANAYLDVDAFKGTLNSDLLRQDVYLSNSSGRIAAGFGGVRISGFDAGELLKMKSKGIGGDIGIVYEYRPLLQEGGDGVADPYKVKISVALSDIGSIRYKKDLQRSGAYNIDITGSEKLYFNDLDGLGIDDYKAFFNSRPQLFTPVSGNQQTSYSVALPATLNTEIDYHIQKGFYLHLGTQLSLIRADGNAFNTSLYNSIAVTPRFEGRVFGIYVPLSYNQLTKANAGLAVSAGPVFIGSGSVLTALAGHSKQADVHAGIRFGMRR